MKKLLASLSLVLGVAAIASAQTRLSLYEEFTGENCAPCASTNPGFDALTQTSANASKVLVIKYQVPIPSAGPIYTANPEEANNRRTYYSISSAPNGKLDGAYPAGTTGHPVSVTQAMLNTASSIAAPFNINLTGVTITGTTVSATVNISAVTAGSYGTGLKLRVALVEDLKYATAPGTNGETEFTHVVREMYPGPDGQALAGTWAAGATQSITVTGSVPGIVNANNYKFLAVWIQDDADKNVKQAARSYPTLDVASNGLAAPSGLICGVPASVTPTVTIKNLGSTNLTSAVIYFKEQGAATWQTKNWTGSLPFAGTADILLNPVNFTTVGAKVIIDSVAMPNGSADLFTANNTDRAGKSILSSTGGTFPIVQTFEAGNNFTAYADAGGYPLGVANTTPGGTVHYGYNASDYFLYYPNYQLAAGTAGYSILPFANLPAGPKALDFYVAYAPYLNSGGANPADKLDVVYSTNCGTSWTSVWSQSGATLATAAPQTAAFRPTANSQWGMRSVDVTSIPAGAQIALKAQSDYGNDLFIDNINLRAGTVTAIDDIISANSVSVYPNPVSNVLNIKLNAKTSFESTIQIVNVTGQVISTSNYKMVNGSNNISINTSALASGIYFANIVTKDGTTQQKFVKK